MTDSLTNSLMLIFSEKVNAGQDPVTAVLQVNYQLARHRFYFDAQSANKAGLKNIAALHLTYVIKPAFRNSISAHTIARVLHKAGHSLQHTAFAIERTYGPVTPLTLIEMLCHEDAFASANETDIHAALLQAGFDYDQIFNALCIRKTSDNFSKYAENRHLPLAYQVPA